MSLLRNRMVRRFSIIGRIADIAVVGGVALRFAQRKGWIDTGNSAGVGFDNEPDEQPIGLAEIAIAGAALLRLLRRKKR